MKSKQPSLRFCILMDLLGCATYIIPGYGELADIVWAPISAITFFFSFGGRDGLRGAMFNLTEEILPGTDFIPTFTIMWLIQYNRKIKISKDMELSH